MIIVLEGADFSANNIGKVVFNVDLDENVVSMLGRYTRFPAVKTNGYAQALNSFYLSLRDAGVYSKIKLLSIPFYASSIAECSVSIINDSVTAIGFDTDFELSTDNLLKQKSTFNVGGKNHGFSVETDTNDCCLFAITSIPDIGTPTNENYMILCSGVTTNYIKRKNWVANLYNNGWSIQCAENEASPSSFGGRKIEDGPVIGNYYEGDMIFKDSVGQITKEETSSSLPKITCDKIVPLFNTNNIPHLYLYGCAQGLTSTELTALYDALNNFYSVIKIVA